MGGCETNVIINGKFSPLERIILTANGNLQRIMSAYYGAPVIVDVIKTSRLENKCYDRKVNLLVNDKVRLEKILVMD